MSYDWNFVSLQQNSNPTMAKAGYISFQRITSTKEADITWMKDIGCDHIIEEEGIQWIPRASYCPPFYSEHSFRYWQEVISMRRSEAGVLGMRKCIHLKTLKAELRLNRGENLC